MFLRLLFLLTFIPFIEIYFLIRMSDNIGFGNTILVVIATGVLGAWLLRQQGHSILLELQQQGAHGQLPSEAIAKGLFTFVGGVLLLTPGILTDCVGLSLILPVTQVMWKKFFMGSWERAVQNGNVHIFTSTRYERSQRHGPSSQGPLRRENSFNLYQRQQPQQMDSNVIDIQPRSTKTVKKDEG